MHLISFKILMTAIILALQAVDGWETYQFIKRGTGFEANPVVAWLIRRLGLYAGLLVAKGWACAVLIAGWFMGWWAGDLGMGALLALMLFYGFIVVNNWGILYPDRER